MNFYPFNIGDYAGSTRHLTWDEDMAYRRMLDVYYSREAPLPLDKRQIYRLVGANEPRQREAVDAVLIEFFEDGEHGWHNPRADEEIARFNDKRTKAKQSAALRWGGATHSGGNANASGSPANASEPQADAIRTQSEGNAPKTKTKTNISSLVSSHPARANPDRLEATLREAAGWQSNPSPNLFVTGPIRALIDNGADLELDVLPVIRAKAPRLTGTPNWNYFVGPIAEARERRIAAATVVALPTTPRSPTHGTYRQKPSRDEIFDAIDRSIDELERQQTLAGTTASRQGGDENPDEGAA